MVALVAHGPMLGAVAAASVHGLTDLNRPLHELAPYAIVVAPVPTGLVTPLFVACSIQHFARDVGYRQSMLLHACFAALGLTLPQLGWGLFAAYYCCCHAPLHLTRHAHVVPPRFAAALALLAATLAYAMRGVGAFVVTDLMQLGVVAHIAVDEFQHRVAPPLDLDARPRAGAPTVSTVSAPRASGRVAGVRLFGLKVPSLES